MTLLSTTIRAARQCGLTPPTLVLGSGDETWLQMAEWAQEVVDDMAQRHDWRALHKTQTITGDGTTTAFTLGSGDYARLSKMPAVTRTGSTSGFWPAGPLDPPSWIGSTSLPIQSSRPLFQIENGILTSNTAPATGDSFIVSYQSSKPIYSSSIPVTTWLLDADTPLVPERLLLLGLVWRWKAAKGYDYAEAMSSFERAFESLASADWGLIPIETAWGSYDRLGSEFGDLTVYTA